MPLSLFIRNEAEFDLEAARNYYDGIGTDFGDAFLLEYLATVQHIPAMPGRHHFIKPPVRRGSFKRFPYYLAYEEEEAQIIVYRLMHDKQERPGSFRNSSAQ